MRFEKVMLLQGVESRPGFKDPSKMTNEVAFMSGIDQMRFYLNEEQYTELCSASYASPYLVTVNVVAGMNPKVNLVGFVPADVAIDAHEKAITGADSKVGTKLDAKPGAA